jgi:hypothetical protein
MYTVILYYKAAHTRLINIARISSVFH